MSDEAESANPSKQWISKNIVTLGSAAVFTVYSAGYFRTRDAAQRFAGESVQRRNAVATAPASNDRTAPPRNHIDVRSGAKVAVIQPSSSARLESSTPASALAPSVGAPPTPSTPPSPTLPSAKPGAQAPAPQPASAPTPATDSSPAPSPAPARAAAVTSIDSSANLPDKKNESGRLKDGVFYGWGTSRHGDIQASLEIKDGRIIGAYISQCRTQYSCSWVSPLPPEVVDRQSAEVDYVSGATQSSNAFYYAVAEAISKAKSF
jgi:uncharacterized protein with FMN-binding domain